MRIYIYIYIYREREREASTLFTTKIKSHYMYNELDYVWIKNLKKEKPIISVQMKWTIIAGDIKVQGSNMLLIVIF
jgi:hypothetical protein